MARVSFRTSSGERVSFVTGRKKKSRGKGRKSRHKERERATGRYESLKGVCACGHTKGVHVAGGHECIVDEMVKGAPSCDCEKFTKARRA